MIFRPASEEEFEAVKKKYQDATLHLLAVCPDYQGKSLGGKILDEVVHLARKSGRRAIRLDTLKTNLPAQHMYEKAGFTERRTASPAFAYKEESWDRCRMVIERF